MLHLAASLPQLTIASDTHSAWLLENAEIIEEPKVSIPKSTMAIPNGPGLGVSLSRDKLARARGVDRKCGMARREDASLMRRLEPGWTDGLL